jgi:hypothetical protein
MNKEQSIEERLWEYIDGICSAEDRLFIDELIATNQEWKTKYNELLDLQNLLSHQLELDEPSMRFTQNIMEAISKHHIAPAAKTYINKKIVWGIAGFFICSIIGLLIAGLAQMDWSAAGTGSTQIDFSKLNNFNFGGFFNNTFTTVFMMINVVLGLVVLDMYLNRKKQAYRNKEAS